MVGIERYMYVCIQYGEGRIKGGHEGRGCLVACGAARTGARLLLARMLIKIASILAMQVFFWLGSTEDLQHSYSLRYQHQHGQPCDLYVIINLSV